MGVRGFGNTKAEAFEQAALALTAVITDLEKVEPRESINVTCEATDDEALLVDWLNALILEMATRKMLFRRFEVEIDNGERGTGVRGTGVSPVTHAQDARATIKLNGRAWGEKVDVARHEPAVEVKGATYTALRVQPENDRWSAQCVVDV